MVAGVGCRAGVGVDDLLAAVDTALAPHALARGAIDCVAVIPRKAAEPAVAELARRLDVPLVVADELALRAASGRILTRSERSLAATGFGSAAEAAALAVAGVSGRLMGPRVACGSATCAIARRGDGS